MALELAIGFAAGTYVIGLIYENYKSTRRSNGDAAPPHIRDDFKKLKEELKNTSSSTKDCTIEGTLLHHHFDVQDSKRNTEVRVKIEEFDTTEMVKAIRRGMLGCCAGSVYPTHFMFSSAEVVFTSYGTASLMKDSNDIEFKPKFPKVIIAVRPVLNKKTIALCVLSLGLVIGVVVLGVVTVRFVRRRLWQRAVQVQGDNINIF